MAAFFGFGSGYPDFGVGHPQIFFERYSCYPMVFSTKNSEEIKHGGKIIMPSSALEKLARLNISYPMLFKLSNKKRSTHCGVLEFVAEEGRIYIPHWMMNQLYIREGDIVVVQNVSLELATFSKFQPQSVDFLDITNPKAVYPPLYDHQLHSQAPTLPDFILQMFSLESKLRSFACLTKGDIIGIEYNEKIYELLVVDTQPREAVSIIECDMKVDFAPPVGYVPPEPESMNVNSSETDRDEREDQVQQAIERNNTFKAFSGGGQRLDGKTKNLKPPKQEQPVHREKGIPNYNYKKGKLTFVKAKLLRPNPEEPMEETVQGFVAFSGTGEQLRIRKKNKS